MKTINQQAVNRAIGLTLLLTLSKFVSADSDTSAESGGSNVAVENSILITATRLAREVEQVAGTITLIDSEELEKQMAEDMDDIVRYQPGLSMQTRDRGGNQGIIIRGIGGKRVLMLLDGIKSSDAFSAGPSAYGNDSYELDDLKSIEIIRGPASALYGADALGGVVLLNSKDPIDYVTDDNELYLRLNSSFADANDLKKIGFTAAAQNKDWGYLFQVTHRDFVESEVKGEGQLTPQDGSSTSALLKLVYQSNENNKLTLTLDSQLEEIDFDLTSESSPDLPSIGFDDNDRKRFSVAHDWSGTSAFADNIDSRIFVQNIDGLQHTNQMRSNSFSFDSAPFGNNTPTRRITDFEFNQDVYGASTALFKTFESDSMVQSLVYGINYEVVETERPRDRCETDTVSNETTCSIRAYPMAAPEVFPNTTFPDTKTTRFGIFVQDEILLGDTGLTIIPGLRYDRIKMNADSSEVQDIVDLGFDIESTDESEVSANLGGIYDLSDSSAIFLQYAEGFRPPSYDEANQAFVNLGFGYATVPNPDLQPETSQGWELGYKSRIGNNFISFAVYDNHFEDFISSQFIGEQDGLSLFQDTNIGKVRIYGAEFTGIWQLSEQWKIRSSIAYSVGEDEENDTELNQVEPLSAVVAASYDKDDWGYQASLTLVDRKDDVAEEGDVTASGYGAVDLTGHYDFSKELRIRIGAFNLFDKQYARWANIQGLSAESSSIAKAQEPGREFRLALSWQF